MYTKIMSLTDDVLTICFSGYHTSYKAIRRKLVGLEAVPYKYKSEINYQNIKEQTLKTTLYRLKKKGLLEKKKDGWVTTKIGKNLIEKKLKHFKQYQKSFKKDLIIIFDIPEEHKKERYWLRKELINLGFKLLQKSVWIGPAALPEEFIQYLNQINILPYLKFFAAKEVNIV